MNCRQAKDKIRSKLDGTLDREDVVLLDEHLEQCPKCRRDLATLAATVEWLEDLEPVEPPSGFNVQVLRRFREEHARAEDQVGWGAMWKVGFGRLLRPALAGVLLLAVSVFLGPPVVRLCSAYVSPRLAESLAQGTVRLVEIASDPDEIEAITDRAKTVSAPASLVGRSVYRGLLGLVVPAAMWCTIGIAGVGFIWWVSKYSLQRRTRDAHLVV